MAKVVKVKGHKREDGTKVKAHKRKVSPKRSRLSDAKGAHSRVKAALRKALRTGATKEDVASLKKMVYNMRGRVGEERNVRTHKRMSKKHKARSYKKGTKGTHLARTKF